MQMPRALRQFLLQSAVWTGLCLGTEAVCLLVLHWKYPYNIPAVPISSIFGDFRSWVFKFQVFHRAQFFFSGSSLMYPAPVLVCYRIFLIRVSDATHPVIATLRFLGIILATSWVMLWQFRKALIARGLDRRAAAMFVLGVYLLSFPFWFEVYVANMEFAVWVVLTLGIWAFWTKRPWVASVFFGIAVAMKIFPFVFLGLFLAKKQYRQMAAMLAVAAVTTVASLWMVCPDIRYSWQQTNLAVAQFRTLYMLEFRPIESGFDHSLFCVFKKMFPTLPGTVVLGHYLSVYLAVAALGGVVLFFARIRKLPLVNQIACLSIAAILLPPTSYDYTLLHLYAPFALLVFVVLETAAKGLEADARRGLTLAFVLLAFLLSAQEEFIWHGLRVAGQVKAIALLALWVVVLIYPFRTERDEVAIA